MIIEGIDISTPEGCNEFNKKQTSFKAYVEEDGAINVKCLKTQEHIIYYDGEDSLFKMKKL